MASGPDHANEALNAELLAGGADLSRKDEILRSVLAGCGDCIKILDLDGRLQFMSEGGKRVMEVDDFSILKGCPWPDFWEGQGNADAHAAIAAAKAGEIGNFKGAANTAKGTSRYWDVTVSPIRGADGKPSQILSISRDVTIQHELEQRQNWLASELAHRIKNTLAVVIAISNQTLRGKEDPKTERDALTSRLIALSDAQDLLTESSWRAAPIRMVIEGALAPYRPGQGRIHLSGPDFDLEWKQALALALAIHELATNAIKYGALSEEVGRIDIDWKRTASSEGVPAFALEWRESDGPPVIQPKSKGFGSRLIEGLLAKDFGGSVSLTYAPAGFECRLTTALANLVKETAG
jgi:two-component sensor histidine kinase